jgi:hypothetical protein
VFFRNKINKRASATPRPSGNAHVQLFFHDCMYDRISGRKAGPRDNGSVVRSQSYKDTFRGSIIK